MDIIILGGNSPHNKPWVRELAAALKPLTQSVLVHNYAHWDSPESEDINIDTELSALEAELAGKTDYVIVAKSIGTVLTALGVGEGTFKPKACVLMGVPLRMIERHNVEYAEAFTKAGCPLVFIQNTHDPLGSFTEVKDYLERSKLSAANYQLVELPGDTHNYTELETLKQIVASKLA